MLRNLAFLSALFGAALTASTAQAQAPAINPALPTIRVCTAKVDGNYHFAGIQFNQQAKGLLNVVLVPTKGSLENLEKLDKGECDTAIVQSDAYGVYSRANPSSSLNIERSRSLYQEVLHFVCNTAAGLDKITDLTSRHTILVGENGGGASVTWQSFVNADKKRYEPVQTRPIGGDRALAQVQEGTDATCMLYVAGLRSPAMQNANNVAATSNGRLRLVPTNDSDLLNTKDPRGRPVYSAATIDGGTYRNLQTGFFGSSVRTIAVDALLVTNVSYIDGNGAAYDKFLRAANASMPAINNRLTGTR